MSKPNQYTAQQFIEAIQGSGGIVSTIAKRLGTNWLTAKKYIENYPTIKAAYDAECEGVLDMAESVLITNIQLAHKQQLGKKTAVDTGDVKWLLSRKGKGRGFAEKQEVSILVEQELEKALDTLEKELPPDVYSSVISALAGKDS